MRQVRQVAADNYETVTLAIIVTPLGTARFGTFCIPWAFLGGKLPLAITRLLLWQ